VPRPRTTPDTVLSERISVNVSPDDLVEIDAARGKTTRPMFFRTAALNQARAGVKAKEPK